MFFTFLSGNLFQMDAIDQTLRTLRILPLNALKELENRQPAAARLQDGVSCILSPVHRTKSAGTEWLVQNG